MNFRLLGKPPINRTICNIVFDFYCYVLFKFTHVLACIHAPFPLWLDSRPSSILFIHSSLMDTHVVFSFQLLECCCYEGLYTNFFCCLNICFPFSWMCTNSGTAGSYTNSVIQCLTSWAMAKVFPKWLHHFRIPAAMREVSSFFTSLPIPIIVWLKKKMIGPEGVRRYLLALIWIS